MSASPTPDNEESRLTLLRELGVLNTEQETLSQSLVAAAASIAETPMAAISLIDADRQWFKGSFGLSVSETSRYISFCAHAILEAEPLIVPNALVDPRFG